MAGRVTVQYFDVMSFAFDVLTLDSSSRTKAVYLNAQGATFTLKGEDFRYEDGVIERGRVQEALVRDPDGDPVMRISNFEVNAKFVAADTPSQFYIGVLFSLTLHGGKIIGSSQDDVLSWGSGNDMIFGGKGNDEIDGGAGRDVMAGGAGLDQFTFAAGYGRDTIRDFDAEGGIGFQDLIDAEYTDLIAIVKTDRNTVLIFGDGDKLTLMNVKPGQINDTDFVDQM